MGRKGKTQKHSAKEIANKHKAAKERAGGAGGGGAGAAARKANMFKVKVKCRICLAEQPHMSGMRNHYENKHPKEAWSDDLYQNDFGAVKESVKSGDKTKTDKKSVAQAKKPKQKKNDLSLLDGY
mmetsp:Transcript_12614/g.20374  ORF Transcript_12614/g.20374 Transcript_12614/m.20374 type:complete len:125 (-) Transcript_12614:1178-1552(-)|eukprot:CAMPEP_0203749552 /NCGR_PEP_ID=MMETSP0098-20131031/4072_1 /ASSEMBLY_ACC=CAM_ASM_000208 /TAXON_ID=96639 /ORGANISM=" , Strain NY0313808BC1" /LENGTH=124 /DNA_ID=CAMNT_0050638627 /DNA_START=106 /DNA_END=480 /DNA_ORIENTATION=-